MVDIEQMAADAAEMQDSGGDALRRTVVHGVTLQKTIANLEAEIKDLKKELRPLIEKDIPMLLDKMSVGKTEVLVGNTTVTVGIENMPVGSIAKAPDIEEAVAYLEANGFEGGVLTELSVDFREDEREQIEELRETLQLRTDKDIHIERKINATTLRFFVRDQKAKDPSFDETKVGISIMRRAKLNAKED